MRATIEPTPEQLEWLAEQFDGLVSNIQTMSVSEWAEAKRYLPQQASPLPGPFRYEVTPYLKEIVDCLSVESPIREVAVMKGVQIGATVGVLENAIGYAIEHVKTSPVMILTADADLAKLRLESYIIPMLQLSELDHLIRSSDEKNPRKTGRTEKKIEWEGGGFLIPFGVNNAGKLRSFSIWMLLRDEVDAYPQIVGKDGDPMKLSADRCAAFESSRKILDISTPTIEGQSAIKKRYLEGDQRKYYVRCVRCSFPQVLRFNAHDNETGDVSGMRWETDNGQLVPGSVRYHCVECGHPHTNDDKTKLLSPECGAEWKPTAVPVAPWMRSYHLSALYSPPGMQTWETCVRKWLDAWDADNHVARDNRALQVFYNNVLGETFRVRGDKLRIDQVSSHRRDWYRFGQVPNKQAQQFCGGPVLVLTCSVDVHKDNLAVAVFGWCRDRRAVLVYYERFLGDTSNLNDPGTWGRLHDLLASTFVADDGKRYRLPHTLIDSGYKPGDEESGGGHVVYEFCNEYHGGVYPVKGVPIAKAAKREDFAPFTTNAGIIGYGITVDVYKDRWAAALKREWDGQSIQPEGHFNAPSDITDKQLKELTAESKVAKRDSANRLIGYEWKRPSGAANELWDLLVYNNAALDMLAWDLCCNKWEMPATSWQEFWRACADQRLFFEE